MALATNKIDLNTSSNSFVLPKELSQEVWSKAAEESAVMQLANRMDLPGSGAVVPIVDTSAITVDIVEETTEKPVSAPTLGSKVMAPIKLAAIIPFSNEFRRDLPRAYDTIVRDAPKALMAKFDRLVFNGATSMPSDFDTLSDATVVTIAGDNVNTYDALVAAKAAVATGGYMLDGWALAPQAETALLVAKDSDGRPLFINNAITDGSVSRILGEQAIFTRNLYVDGDTALMGVAGDWSQAFYGIVEDITVKFSDQATINDGTNQINLWQRNMFAMLIEATVGFAVKDKTAFVTLKG